MNKQEEIRVQEQERIISLLYLWRESVCSSDLNRLIRLAIRREPPSQLYQEHGQTQCAWLDKHFIKELERVK